MIQYIDRRGEHAGERGALDALDADARQGEGHPLLLPPGILAYMARNLREAGLVNLKASDLAEHDPFAVGGSAAPTPFLGLLGGPRPTGVGDLMAAMRAGASAVSTSAPELWDI